jgi:uncharacterized protein YjiK
LFSCTKETQTYASPDGYDLTAPEKMIMKESLLEISGLTWVNDDTFLALNDEEGKVFFIPWMGNDNVVVKFTRNGDFEDVTKYKHWIFALRSDGSIYSFPDTTSQKTKAKELVNGLPKGNYEGLYADELENKLYVLCKKCKAEKSDDNVISGYAMELLNDSVSSKMRFSIGLNSLPQVKLDAIKNKFLPSAVALNKLTNEWFIISSASMALLIADKDLNAKELYPLNPHLFNQPEGITFDHENNLYISNEGDELQNGNVLKFAFRAENKPDQLKE